MAFGGMMKGFLFAGGPGKKVASSLKKEETGKQETQYIDIDKDEMDLGLGRGVRNLQMDEELLDFTIIVEDQELKVHKVVLASVSHYFRTLLCGSMKQDYSESIELKEIKAEAVSKIIELIYTRKTSIARENTTEILECAVYFQMPEIIDFCRKHLMKQLNIANCMSLLSIFTLYSFTDEQKKVDAYVRRNLDVLIEKAEPKELSPEGIKMFAEEWPRDDFELFNLIKSWAELDWEKHNRCLDALMPDVRFCLLSKPEVREIKEMDIFTKSEGCAWTELVTKAEDYHKLPGHLKVLDVGIQSTVRGNTAKPLVLTNEYESEIEAFVYTLENTSKSTWKRGYFGNTMDLDEYPKYTVHGSIIVNNFMILCESIARDPEESWGILDPRQQEFLEMAGMPEEDARPGFAMVHHADKLYVLGGFVGRYFGIMQEPIDTVLVYDLKTNEWSKSDIKLPVATRDHAACVIDNKIYVSGGLYQKAKKTEKETCCMMKLIDKIEKDRERVISSSGETDEEGEIPQKMDGQKNKESKSTSSCEKKDEKRKDLEENDQEKKPSTKVGNEDEENESVKTDPEKNRSDNGFDKDGVWRPDLSGMRDRKKNIKTSKVYCLDLTTGEWSRKAKMPHSLLKHSMHALTSSSGQFIVVVSQDLKVTHYSPTEDCWSEIKLPPCRINDNATVEKYLMSRDVVMHCTGSIVYALNTQAKIKKDPKPHGDYVYLCDHDDINYECDSNCHRMWHTDCIGDSYCQCDDCEDEKLDHFAYQLCLKWDFSRFGPKPASKCEPCLTQESFQFADIDHFDDEERDEPATGFCSSLLNVPYIPEPEGWW